MKSENMETTRALAKSLFENGAFTVILSRGAFRICLAKHPPEEAKVACYFPLAAQVLQRTPLIAQVLRAALESQNLQLIEANVLYVEACPCRLRRTEYSFSVQFDTEHGEAVIGMHNESVLDAEAEAVTATVSDSPAPQD